MHAVYEALFLRHVALIPLLLAVLGAAQTPSGPQGEAGIALLQSSFLAAPEANGEKCNCADNQCDISKVRVRQDHTGQNGLSLTDVGAIYGGFALSKEQRGMVTLASVATTSLECLDDRVTEPSVGTPGGDLGEFILALGAYLTERDSESTPTQQVVDMLLEKYVESVPEGRPVVHCTDDRAVEHLESEIPMENLNLAAPPDHAKGAGLLEKLTNVENQGDSHIRLMLKHPEWYQVSPQLVPMVLKSFYNLLWRQNQDSSSPLYHQNKLRLNVLSGSANPQAFLEIASSDSCQKKGVAPMITPRTSTRSVLVSHLDAVSLRREELASFFARIANVTPRKINKERLHQRLDRHGWLALETTGSHIASGLPFYSLTYQ